VDATKDSEVVNSSTEMLVGMEKLDNPVPTIREESSPDVLTCGKVVDISVDILEKVLVEGIETSERDSEED
jgi:hypothetical protein